VDNPEFTTEVLQDFNKTFDTPHGKRVLEMIKNFVSYDKIFNPRNNDGGIDPYKLAGHNAQRSVIIYIETKLKGIRHDTNPENKKMA